LYKYNIKILNKKQVIPILRHPFFVRLQWTFLESGGGCGEEKGVGEKESPQPPRWAGVPRHRRGTFQNQEFLIK